MSASQREERLEERKGKAAIIDSLPSIPRQDKKSDRLSLLSLHEVWRIGIILQEANPMSDVFRNIDPHPLTARRVSTPPPPPRGEDTLAGWRGGGGSIVRKEARLCSVLYICM